ncbi:MAG: hypothetical protein ACREAB_19465 [Blastocatellia bacterium]
MPAQFDLSALSRRRSAKFALALLMAVGAITLVTFTARAWRNKTGSTPGQDGAAAQQEAQAQPAPVTSGLFVASALPVTIAVGAPNSDKGFPEIPLAINAKAASKVTNLSLVLFELSQTGKLLGAESINGVVDLTAKRSDNFPLRVRRRVKFGSPVILAVESAHGPDESWQIDFSELLQAAIAVAGNKPIPAVNVNQKQDRQGVDYGSNHCARAFALASHLSKFSESGGMPSFYCDQQTRGYFFSYSPPGKTR